MSEASAHRINIPSELKLMLRDFYGNTCPHCDTRNGEIHHLNDLPNDSHRFANLVPVCGGLNAAAYRSRMSGLAAARGLVEILRGKAKQFAAAPDSWLSYPLAYLCSRMEAY